MSGRMRGLRQFLVLAVIVTFAANACGGDSEGASSTAASPTPIPHPASIGTPRSLGQPLSGNAYAAPRLRAPLPEGQLVLEALLAEPTIFTVEDEDVHGLALAYAYAVSPDGRRIASLDTPLGSQDEAPRTVRVRSTDGADVFQLTVNYPTSEPLWSPAGDWLSFAAADELYVVDADGREIRRYNRPEGSDLVGWINGGSSLLLRRQPRVDKYAKLQLFALDAQNGHTTEIPLPAGSHPDFTLSPDGKRLALSVGSWQNGWHLWVLYTTTGESCEILPQVPYRYEACAIAPFRPEWSVDSRWIAYSDEAGKTFAFANLHVADAWNCRDRLVSDAASEVVWSPDAVSLAITVSSDKTDPAASRTVHLWSPSAGLEALNVQARVLSWSPDGSTLAGYREHSVIIIDAESGKSRDIKLNASFFQPGSLMWSPGGRHLVGTSLEHKFKSPKKLGRLYLIDLENARSTLLFEEPREYRLVVWVPAAANRHVQQP